MIERVYHCDWKDCYGHVSTIMAKPEHPGFLTVTETGSGTRPLHFCTWDCLLKYAAQFEPPTIIPMRPDEEAAA
jgi:hypothetical protein